MIPCAVGKRERDEVQVQIYLYSDFFFFFLPKRILGQTKKYVCFRLHASYNYGRQVGFFILFFAIILICLKYVFMKTELLYLHFQSVAWCHGPFLLIFNG